MHGTGMRDARLPVRGRSSASPGPMAVRHRLREQRPPLQGSSHRSNITATGSSGSSSAAAGRSNGSRPPGGGTLVQPERRVPVFTAPRSVRSESAAAAKMSRSERRAGHGGEPESTRVASRHVSVAEERPYIVGEQSRFLQRGEVAASRHVGPASDSILRLGPAPRRSGDLVREVRHADRHLGHRMTASFRIVPRLEVHRRRRRDRVRRPVEHQVRQQIVRPRTRRALGRSTSGTSRGSTPQVPRASRSARQRAICGLVPWIAL